MELFFILCASIASILAIWFMAKSKHKSDCEGGVLPVVTRINEQFHLLLQFLRRVEDTNQKRHEELLKAIGSSHPGGGGTMVWMRKRREKIE